MHGQYMLTPPKFFRATRLVWTEIGISESTLGFYTKSDSVSGETERLPLSQPNPSQGRLTPL